MNLVRAILDHWQRQRKHGVCRVVVVVLEGLNIVQVDHLLQQGLLQYLALLTDIGIRFETHGAAANDCDAVCTALRVARIRAASLSGVPLPLDPGLDDLCAADRAQQEQLIAALKSGRNSVVVAKFDMLRQLARLFGPRPDADQQLVIRDVYARMDEVVGKALSCCDSETALLVAIPPTPTASDFKRGPDPCVIFCNRRCDPPPPEEFHLAKFIRRHLNSPSRDA